MLTKKISLILSVAFCATAASAQTSDYPEPLRPETTPNVLTLPAEYPESWIYVHDVNIFSLVDGRATIVDVAADTAAIKGQIPMVYFGSLLVGTRSPKIYVTETFYSRHSRGERTDVLTIWDKATLAPEGEIVLPGGRRGLLTSATDALQFTNDERWVLVYNFTPAASVSVVDLESRQILSNIDVPGCSLAYPTGERGFSTLCSDGTVMSVTLGPDGQLTGTYVSDPINNVDDDPMFMIPTRVGSVAWFATFNGEIRGIDLAGERARDLGAFQLPHEVTAEGEWRPSGSQVITSDPSGRLYVLMTPNGKEGSHKDGGTEVWVVDPVTQARVARYPLVDLAGSIYVAGRENPLLVAARMDGTLDVYDPGSGEIRRTIPSVALTPGLMGSVQ